MTSRCAPGQNRFGRQLSIACTPATLNFVSGPLPSQVATLGAVIMHEMGHALRPSWRTNHSFTSADRDATARFEACIAADFQSSGSTPNRSVMTINEDFADAVGYRAMIRYSRTISLANVRRSILLFAQTWCSASRPRHYPSSYTDPHAANFLRDNATVKGERSFYVAYGCPIQASYIC